MEMIVSRVETKGRQDYPQWSDLYKILFSQDGENWMTYQEPFGTEKVRISHLLLDILSHIILCNTYLVSHPSNQNVF